MVCNSLQGIVSSTQSNTVQISQCYSEGGFKHALQWTVYTSSWIAQLLWLCIWIVSAKGASSWIRHDFTKTRFLGVKCQWSIVGFPDASLSTIVTLTLFNLILVFTKWDPLTKSKLCVRVCVYPVGYPDSHRVNVGTWHAIVIGQMFLCTTIISRPNCQRFTWTFPKSFSLLT